MARQRRMSVCCSSAVRTPTHGCEGCQDRPAVPSLSGAGRSGHPGVPVPAQHAALPAPPCRSAGRAEPPPQRGDKDGTNTEVTAPSLSPERTRSGNGLGFLDGRPRLGSPASLDLGPFSDEFTSFVSPQHFKRKQTNEKAQELKILGHLAMNLEGIFCLFTLPRNKNVM